MPKQQMKPIATISPRDLLLMLIGMDDLSADEGFGGLTRIQKLLFLLESEEHIVPSGDGFRFEAYKAGPYSPRVYDDLELLENLDFIRRSGTGDDTEVTDADSQAKPEASEPEKAEVDLTFDQLMGPEDILASGSEDISPTADSYEESRFYLTPSGKKRMEDLLANREYKPFVDGIRKVKSRFSKYSLNDLLYYVYTRHPKMTTESEIKEKVLRRRPA